MITSAKERHFEGDEKLKLAPSFVWRRLHSLLGLWLVVYLTYHLLVNSQAALFFQDSGNAFITAANQLEALPYVKIIELVFLGIPFVIHGIWGIYYVWTSKPNTYRSDGSVPELPQYKRNRAYTWQRITAWLLVPAILLHVFQMRFWAYPTSADKSDQKSYFVKVTYDPGLTLVAHKLKSSLFTSQEIAVQEQLLQREESELATLPKDPSNADYVRRLDQVENQHEWMEAAMKRKITVNEILSVSSSPGAALYLLLRETFKSPSMVVLYSLFVIIAAYHAFQGLWTFLITWGITLTRRSQKRMRTVSHVLMGIVILLGLMAAWGTYWTIQWQQ